MHDHTPLLSHPWPHTLTANLLLLPHPPSFLTLLSHPYYCHTYSHTSLLPHPHIFTANLPHTLTTCHSHSHTPLLTATIVTPIQLHPYCDTFIHTVTHPYRHSCHTLSDPPLFYIHTSHSRHKIPPPRTMGTVPGHEYSYFVITQHY